MQTLKASNDKSAHEESRLHRTSGDLCRCRMCRRDVRRDIHHAYIAFNWKRVRGATTGLQKTKLFQFDVVCSETCGYRLKKVGPGWTFRDLFPWFGDRAFIERDELIRDHWVSASLRDAELPRLLCALMVPVTATVVKIRRDMRAIVDEAREVIEASAV